MPTDKLQVWANTNSRGQPHSENRESPTAKDNRRGHILTVIELHIICDTVFVKRYIVEAT